MTHSLGDMAGISGVRRLGVFFGFLAKKKGTKGNIWSVVSPRSDRRQLVPADKPIRLLHLSSVWGNGGSRQTQGYDIWSTAEHK